MNGTTILEKRKDQLVLRAGDGRVMTVPLTPYTELKYVHFAGNRISYRFGDGMEVQETYNDGVFNCTYGGHQLQIRSRDILAVTILKHMRCMGPSLYEALFREEYEKHHQADLLKYMLAGYRDRVRVVTTDYKNGAVATEVYIDDGLFKVDWHSNAYVMDFADTDADDGQHDWYRPICIVASTVQSANIDTPVGTLKMDERTMTTLAKTMFLLNPNLDDRVFTSQLPQIVLDELKTRSCTLMSVRKLVRAINEAMRKDDHGLVRQLVGQNVENAKKAVEYLPPKHRFFVKNALAEVSGPVQAQDV